MKTSKALFFSDCVYLSQAILADGSVKAKRGALSEANIQEQGWAMSWMLSAFRDDSYAKSCLRLAI